MDASVPKLLVEKLTARARWAKIVEVAPLVLYIDPKDVATRTAYATALVELKRTKEARRKYETALTAEPTDLRRTRSRPFGPRGRRVIPERHPDAIQVACRFHALARLDLVLDGDRARDRHRLLRSAGDCHRRVSFRP